jgi:6-phospho-3-hexuloisomerase
MVREGLTMVDSRALAWRALNEVNDVLAHIAPDAADRLASEMLGAGSIVCYGLGREGLMIRAFCMRLMHLGLDAHMAGDVTTPPIGPSDALLVSSGPGNLATVRTMIQLARAAGSRVIAITAQPDGPDPRSADHAIVIPAQTMANDAGSHSILPMGTAFEIALLVYLDLVAIRIRELSGQSLEQIRARHYNLE